MIILMGFSIMQVVLGVLGVSLGLLLLVISYKKFLAYLGKREIAPDDYCVLNELETHPAKGEVEFYFTSKRDRNVIINLLNDDLSFHSKIFEELISEGGKSVRFDTKTVPNETYFYQLETDNQKTMKRFTIEN
jgi:hypothetical protein